MKDEIAKMTDYFRKQNEKLTSRIYEQEQVIENINETIGELKEHISIIRKDITRENNIFYPADLKSKLNDKMESLISKKKEYESELQLLNRNLNEIHNEYENNLKMKNTFYALKKMAFTREAQEDKKAARIIDDILEKIKLCQSLIEVDKERCKLELDNIIRTYGDNQNVSRETLK